MKKIFYLLFSISIIFGLSSCSDDQLETAPTDSVTGPVLFATTDGAMVAMNGVYRMLYTAGWSVGNESQNFGIMSTKMFTSLMGEDFLQDAQGNGWFYFDYRFDVRSRYTSAAWRSYATWNFYYTLISNVNYILAEVPKIEGDQAIIDNIMAQALSLRAYSYFQLIQIFQQTYKGNESKPGVPIYVDPTTAASEGKGRGTVEDVYTQINEDLNEAIRLFKESGLTQSHKSHIDYYVANAFKANVSLVQNKWSDAASYAKEALTKSGMTLTTGSDLTSGFNSVKPSSVMWGAEVIADQSGIYASFFSHMDARADRYAKSSRKCIYNWLYDRIPNDDKRKDWWNGPTDGGTNDTKPYNQYKFQYSDISTDLGDYVFMRSDEMQLVLAEALCHDQKYPEAKTELEKLMKLRMPEATVNSVLEGIEMSNQNQMGSIGSPKTLMDHILLQRRIELWGEAERIYDLQRLKMGFDRRAANSNHSQQVSFDSSIPGSKEFILTIPQKEFDGNPNMDATADQNPL